jgi:hypothetical protein
LANRADRWLVFRFGLCQIAITAHLELSIGKTHQRRIAGESRAILK